MNFSRRVLFHRKTTVCLKYYGQDWSSLEPNICDYSNTYILFGGNINVTGGDVNTKVAFKNCAPFRKCKAKIKETFVAEAQWINIAMPMYHLIEYSNNYSGNSGSLKEIK